MRKPGGSLTRGLDKEVYAAVCKLLDSSDDIRSPYDLSIDSVYTHLKKCNSSLNRKSKILLEDSIARILEVLKEDYGEPDSLDGFESEKDTVEAQKTRDLSNAMNRRLTQSWNMSTISTTAPNDANGVTDRGTKSQHSKKRQSPEPDVEGNEDQQHSKNGTTSKQQSRSSKRSKTSVVVPNTAEPALTISELGGMDEQIERLRKLLVLPFRDPEWYKARGVKIPCGILLHGPPGCGKTMLCQAVAHSLGAPMIAISAPSIVSGMSGESEKALREHFEKAKQIAPAIIFIDEIDAITPKRESAQREMERRIVSQLLTCMDDIPPGKNDGKPVMVLAATNRPDSLDTALRRAGRFDVEIELGVPNLEARKSILRKLTAKMPLADGIDFDRLGRATAGFVGADLSSLATEAADPMAERYEARLQNLAAKKWSQEQGRDQEHKDVQDAQDVDMIDSSNTDVYPSPGSLQMTAAERFIALSDLLKDGPPASEPSLLDHVTMTDFLDAASRVQASATREGFATIPNVPWDTIGAYHETRQKLLDNVVKPIQNPAIYARFNISPPGVLLYGPPGCGKTLLASAVASSARANFMSVKGPELLNKYVGESEKAVRQLFARARYSQPVVIFFDELDALVPRRDDAKSEASNRVVNAMLAEMDGLASKGEVYVIAATNRKDVIDPAMLRHGRLGTHIYVGLPGPQERVEVLETILKKQPLQSEGEDSLGELKKFAETCDGFSGADLQSLVHEASLAAISRGSEVLEAEDLSTAKLAIKPGKVNPAR